MASGVPTFSWAPTVAWRRSWLLSCSTRIRAGTASSATSPIYPKVSATAARIFHFWSCNTRINPGQISIIALIAPGVPILNKAVEALKRTYSCLSCMLELEQVLHLLLLFCLMLLLPHHEQTITRLAILESVPELSPFFSSFPITLLQKHGLPDLDLSRIELEQVPHPLSLFCPMLMRLYYEHTDSDLVVVLGWGPAQHFLLLRPSNLVLMRQRNKHTPDRSLMRVSI